MTVKISELPVATEFESGDVIPIVQDGSTKQLDANGNWTFGAIDGTPIGGSTPSTGAFTSVDIDGGTIDGATIGASSASTGAFTTLTASDDVNFDSGTLFVDASADAVGIGTTSPAKTLDVSGEIRASTGILFGSDTAAANTLDDYEEGTWSPFWTWGGGGTAVMSGITNARYTRIGNCVFCFFRIATSSVTSASGDAIISGLPFSGGGANSAVTIGQASLFNTDMNIRLFYAGGTSIAAAKNNTNGGYVSVSAGDFKTSGTGNLIDGFLSYMIP